MIASVRLLILRRVESLLHQSIKVVSKYLREADVHSQAGADMGFGLVANVNNSLGQRQIDNAIYQSCLSEQAGNCGRYIALDDPVYIAYAKRLAAPNQVLISHQKIPHSSNHPDMNKLNAKVSGVES